MSDWTWNLPTTGTPGQAPPPPLTMPPTITVTPPTIPPPTPASLQPPVPADPTLWVTPDTLPPPNARTDQGIIATPPGGYPRPPTTPITPATSAPVAPGSTVDQNTGATTPPPGFLPDGRPDPNYRGAQPPITPSPPTPPTSPSTTPGTLPPPTTPPRFNAQPQTNYPPALNGIILAKEGSGQYAVSPKGAIGTGQIMPATAARYGVTPDQLFNPQINAWVRQQETQRLWNKYHDPTAVLIGYNAGDGAVDRWLKAGRDPSVLPPETQRYISGTGLPGAPPTQNLIPAEAREPADWGKPYQPGPDMGLPGVMPTERDIPNIMNNNALALLAVASAALHAPLYATIGAYGAYLQAANKRQILDQKINQTKWQEALKESNAQQEMEGQAYGEAFATYGSDVGDLDAKLAAIANRYGDGAMLNALAQGGAKAAHDLQQYRDQHFQPLSKLGIQQQQQQDINSAAAAMDRQFLQANPNATPDQIAIAHAQNVGRATAMSKGEVAKEDPADRPKAGNFTWTAPDGSTQSGYAIEQPGVGLVDPQTKQPIPIKPGTYPSEAGTAKAAAATPARAGTVDQMMGDWLQEQQQDPKRWSGGAPGQGTYTPPSPEEEAAERGRLAGLAKPPSGEGGGLEVSKLYDVVDKNGNVVQSGVELREGKTKSGFVHSEDGSPLELKPGERVRQTTPTTTTGGRAGAQTLRQIIGGREVLSDLQNVSKLPVGTTTGVLGTYVPGTTMTGAVVGDLGRKLTSDDAKMMQASMAGLTRELSTLMSPVYGGNYAAQQLDPLIPKEGDDIKVAMFKLARLAQTAENAFEGLSSAPWLSQDQKNYVKQLDAQVKAAIPWTTDQAIDFANRDQPRRETFGDYVQRNKVAGGSGTGSQAAPAVGTVQDGYRFKGGDASNPANWEKQ